MTLVEHLAGQMAALRAGRHVQGGARPRDAAGTARQGRRPRGRHAHLEQLPRPRQPPADPRGRRRRRVERWGAGMGSVRFICGTQLLHKELEATIAAFYGRDDTILYMSCWSANEAVFATLLDELRRRSSPTSSTTPRSSTASGSARPSGSAHSTATSRRSTGCSREEGARSSCSTSPTASSRWRASCAPLPEIVEVCEQHDAVLVVDDSHATGILGARGRGTAEELGRLGARCRSTPARSARRWARRWAATSRGRRRSSRSLRQRSPPVHLLQLPAAGGRRGRARGVPDGAWRTRRPSRSCATTPRYFRERDARRPASDPARRCTRSCRSSSATPRWRSRWARRCSSGASTSPGSATRSCRRARRGCAARSPPAHERADLDKAVDAFVKVGKKFGVV